MKSIRLGMLTILALSLTSSLFCEVHEKKSKESNKYLKRVGHGILGTVSGMAAAGMGYLAYGFSTYRKAGNPDFRPYYPICFSFGAVSAGLAYASAKKFEKAFEKKKKIVNKANEVQVK